jgi:hypothetical protein
VLRKFAGVFASAKAIPRGLKELSKIPSNPNEILTFPEMLVFP